MPSPAPTSVAPPPVSTPAPPKDEFVMSIDSDPSGATIVINGIPIGKAPLQLKVKTTLQGFFRDYMTVKARFLATSSDETSITVEDDCTPREKIPEKIMFTPQGSQRRQQGQIENEK
jgi:PEGA domain